MCCHPYPLLSHWAFSLGFYLVFWLSSTCATLRVQAREHALMPEAQCFQPGTGHTVRFSATMCTFIKKLFLNNSLWYSAYSLSGLSNSHQTHSTSVSCRSFFLVKLDLLPRSSHFTVTDFRYYTHKLQTWLKDKHTFTFTFSSVIWLFSLSVYISGGSTTRWDLKTNVRMNH